MGFNELIECTTWKYNCYLIHEWIRFSAIESNHKTYSLTAHKRCAMYMIIHNSPYVPHMKSNLYRSQTVYEYYVYSRYVRTFHMYGVLYNTVHTVQYMYRFHVQHSIHTVQCTVEHSTLKKNRYTLYTQHMHIILWYRHTVHTVHTVHTLHMVHTIHTVHTVHTVHKIFYYTQSIHMVDTLHTVHTTHSTHMYLCTDLASLKRAWLELFPTNMVCMMMRQSLTMIPGNKGGNEEWQTKR